MIVRIHPSLPAADIEPVTEDLANYVALDRERGVECYLVGAGSLDVYVLLDGAWRSHPQGSTLTDNGSYARLVIGNSAGPRAVCVVGTGTDETSVFHCDPVLF